MTFKIRRHNLLSSLIIVAGSLAVSSNTMAQTGEHVPGRLLVQPRNGATQPANQLLAALGARLENRMTQIGTSVVRVRTGDEERISNALTRSGLFTFVELDHVAHGGQVMNPNDPNYPSQWHLAKIQGPMAWSLTVGATSITIAVIDSGVDPTHPDLASKLVPGWNFLTSTSNTADVLGHGTAVAGTAAAATNNATGVAGVDWANMIMPLVVLDSSNYASYSNIASAITYAADHGVRVINISIGGSSASSTLQNAVNYAWSKGAVIFASAMNNANSTPYYPAACSNVVAVSATDSNDNLASFSSFGNWIDVSAPGASILTTNMGSGYGYWQGTSFSSPIAAAVAGLILSVKPSLSNSTVVSLLEQTSDDLGSSGWDQYFGYGRVNAYKAVAGAEAIPVDTTPPSVSISSPGNGTTVSGTIFIQGTTTDNVAVASTQLYLDGQQIATSAVTPFSFSWATTGTTNGWHTLMVNSSDAAGNVGSASVTVNVNNTPVLDTQPPTVSIISPAIGVRLNGNTVQITASATDNVGVTQVSIYVDGVVLCTDTTSPYACSWSFKKATTGSHNLSARAWDAAGNFGSATVITVYK